MSSRVFYFVLIFFLLTTCSREKKNFTVSGNLTGNEGTRIFLKEMTTSELIPVDSTSLDESGNFILKGYTDIVRFFTLYASEDDFIILLIRAGDNISISGDANNLYTTYAVEGSDDSKKIRELTSAQNKTLLRIRQLTKIFNDSIHSPDILKIKASLDTAYKEIVDSQRAYTFDFIHQNINSLASLMALYQQIGPRQYLLDPVEDFIYYNIVDSSLNIRYPESEAVRELHRQVVELREQLRVGEMTSRYLGKGIIAPEISLPGPDGDTISLSSLRGNYVLLDFWASWCPPCRHENPNLVMNYNKYHTRGFEIYHVSLDRSRDAWLKAIKDDSLNWIHVSDLRMWNSIVVPIYHIQGIPMNFLLDKEGRIIEQNLQGEKLSSVLDKLFSN